jgi:hypothetical protein
MFESPLEFGIEAMWPHPSYPLLYPYLTAEEVGRLAYYYDGLFPERRSFASLQRELTNAVGRWQQEHPVAFLAVIQRDENLVLVDTRPNSRQRVYTLSPLEIAALNEGRQVTSRQRLLQGLATIYGADAAQDAIMTLQRMGVIICVKERLLSLVEGQVDVHRLDQANTERRLRFG